MAKQNSPIDMDKIMTKNEFYKLGYNDRRTLMEHWRLTHSSAEIKRKMSLSNTAFYALLKRLDLPTNLTEFRDSQPSLLGVDNITTTTHSDKEEIVTKPVAPTAPKVEPVATVTPVAKPTVERIEVQPQPQPQPVAEETFGIELTGQIRQADLRKLIELAKNNDIEIKMKG